MKNDLRKARAFSALMHADGIEPAGRKVLWLLIKHYNLTTGQCNPSYERLAGLGRLDRSTVANQIKKIRKLGLITSKRTGSSNRYMLDWDKLNRIAADFDQLFRGQNAEENIHSMVAPVNNKLEFKTSEVLNLPERRLHSKTRISEKHFNKKTNRIAFARLHEDIRQLLSPKEAAEIYGLVSEDDETAAVQAELSKAGSGFQVLVELAKKRVE